MFCGRVANYSLKLNVKLKVGATMISKPLIIDVTKKNITSLLVIYWRDIQITFGNRNDLLPPSNHIIHGFLCARMPLLLRIRGLV